MYSPQFQTVKPFVLNFLSTNYWRIEQLMSFDDAVGEAQLQFWRTVKRLQNRQCEIKNDKHLFSLFKTSWTRHFTTLSNKNSQQIKTIGFSQLELMDVESMWIGCTDHDGYLHCLLDSAPDEIKQVLALLIKLPDEAAGIITQLIQQQHFSIANKLICQWLGKSTEQCYVQQTLNYFN